MSISLHRFAFSFSFLCIFHLFEYRVEVSIKNYPHFQARPPQVPPPHQAARALQAAQTQVRKKLWTFFQKYFWHLWPFRRPGWGENSVPDLHLGSGASRSWEVNRQLSISLVYTCNVQNCSCCYSRHHRWSEGACCLPSSRWVKYFSRKSC